MNLRIFLMITAVLFFVPVLEAGEILYEKEARNIRLYNRESGKILTYKILNRNEKMDFTVRELDTLRVYSRIYTEDEKTYGYQLTINGEIRDITRTGRSSKFTRTLAGREVSGYNSYLTALNAAETRISLLNTSEFEILFKIVNPGEAYSQKEIDFIRYSPQRYTMKKNLEVKGKTYTYFTADSTNIEFSLEGPVVLKIISRLIFEDNFTVQYNYRYNVYMDEILLSTCSETAYPSSVALLRNKNDRITSRGNVNILEIPAGIHQLKIEDNDTNRDLLFRLFISKSAVELNE
ncbi:MAG: hypothetical protein JXB60_01595 [Candidatus Cloacimonetes bacterium]|nr:hypothetical protein [Candidatus Cloacimonadota bacterium]